MKMWKKMVTSVFTAAMLVCLSAVSVFAAPVEEYTYKVTFYAGNQGSFSGTAGLSVEGSGASVTGGGSQITVSGLKLGDKVSFNVQSGAVSLKEADKYYVKGVRLSGRDNNTAVSSAFRVTGDADYVVAYGIKGSTVGYTVNYQDASGKELAPSNTYYGNVGDKPVVAYLYMENYTPQALALTKTLSANEAENVFTFVYTENKVETILEPGEVITEVVTETVTEQGTTAENDNETTTGGPGNAAANTAGEDGNTAGGPGNITDGEEAGEAGTDTEGGNEESTDTTVIEDEEVPQGDQDLIDLDDEEAPLGNVELEKEVKKGLPLAAGIGIGVGAAAALIILVVVLKKRR